MENEESIFNQLISIHSTLWREPAAKFVRALATDADPDKIEGIRPLSPDERLKAAVIEDILIGFEIGGAVSMQERFEFMRDNVISRMTPGQMDLVLSCDPKEFENYAGAFQALFLDPYIKAAPSNEDLKFAAMFSGGESREQVRVLAHGFHL